MQVMLTTIHPETLFSLNLSAIESLLAQGKRAGGGGINLQHLMAFKKRT
ncbi:MAG: hypothetical protein LJE87_06230 [Deltaproteobacteria bacterium]|nr:hypothetical protein [Deltaproteobacteria bacterium]